MACRSIGAPKKVYDGWKYPDDWIVEGFAQEGPKILRHGDYYHMVLAEGGTAGPPTGHMIVSARVEVDRGPVGELALQPGGPHAVGVGALVVEGPRHAGRSSGRPLVHRLSRLRERLLHAGPADAARADRVDGRRVVPDGRLRSPRSRSPSRRATAVPHGMPFSDDFSADRMGTQWSFYKGSTADRERYRYENGALVLKAKGTSPADCVAAVVRHRRSRLRDRGRDRCRSGRHGGPAAVLQQPALRRARLLGEELLHAQLRPRSAAGEAGRRRQRLHIRLRNDRHIVTMHYSVDGQTWRKYDRGMELSGYHHNVAYEFLSLRPALYAAGSWRSALPQLPVHRVALTRLEARRQRQPRTKARRPRRMHEDQQGNEHRQIDQQITRSED